MLPPPVRAAHAGNVDPFVRQLMSLPPIDPDEERSLARRSRAGDLVARELLITAGLRSVALHARMLGLQGEDLRDAVQLGSIGLIRAVDRFDPDRGVRLATYAWPWIGAEMRRPSARSITRHVAEQAESFDELELSDVLDGLAHDEAQVLRLRFGIGCAHQESLSRRAVGEHLGLSISQVRTLEGKAMRQLRRGLAKVVDRAPHQ